MKSSDFLDALMSLELKAKDSGLSRDEMASAYELRVLALDEEEAEEQIEAVSDDG